VVRAPLKRKWCAQEFVFRERTWAIARHGTHPSLGTRRSVLKLTLDSTGSTVHALLPLPRSSEDSFVLWYLLCVSRRRRVIGWEC
jgi:hypothetical protein